MASTVLVLGGGVGGLVAANALRKKLPKEHRVVLVEREASFLFAPSLLWLMVGERTPEKISRPLDRLSRKGIEFKRGEIRKIEPDRREVIVDGTTIAGDFLVVSLGADLDAASVPGLSEAGHDFYTLAGAGSLYGALERFSGGRIALLTAEPVYRCPAAPYEAAMLVEGYCRKRKIREQTKIDLYAAEPGPMGVAGPEVSQGVRGMVEAKGITYHPEHRVQSVDPAARKLRFANGAEAGYDLLAYVPPHRAPKVVREAGLCGESGWVSADRATFETRFPGVYAIGDAVSIPLKLGKPLPKAGVFAHAEANVVAANIARAILGKGKGATFDGEGECFVETGDGKAGFGKGNFYAEPLPAVKLHPPARRWHAGKVLFEKDWLRRWF